MLISGIQNEQEHIFQEYLLLNGTLLFGLKRLERGLEKEQERRLERGLKRGDILSPIPFLSFLSSPL